MSLKEELIEFVEKKVSQSEHNEFFRKPLVGFSSADDPLYDTLKDTVGHQHNHPKDFLPEAKTVVSIFIPFSDEIVFSNRKDKKTPSFEWAESYVVTNNLIDNICTSMVEYLENKGIAAYTIKATHNYDKKILKADWSHRSAAYIAGLGTFGVNRMLITSMGCAGRFGSVIIAHEIEPNKRPDEEYCLYYKNGKCLACIKVCPVQALDSDSFDRFKCNGQLQENSKMFTDLGKCSVCGKCAVFCPLAIIKSK